jgi:hypothetical protein
MKKIFISLIIFGSGSLIKSNAQSSSKIEDWKLKNRVEKRMEKREGKCGFMKPCHDEQPLHIENDNYAMRVDLAKLGDTSSFTARYISANNNKYGSLRNLSGDAAKVKGYQTRIYKVISKSPAVNNAVPTSTIAYYDLVTIKPPPDERNQSNN